VGGTASRTFLAGLGRAAARHGMIGVLLLLAAFFSVATLREQQLQGEAAAKALAARVTALARAGTTVIVAGRDSDDDRRFATALERAIAEGGGASETVLGEPARLREALEGLAARGRARVAIAAPAGLGPVARSVLADFPPLAGSLVLEPPAYRWPTFLLRGNLLNVANQIAVIAVVAIGMTMVILTGGIDLSVGSLIALAAVVVAWIVERLGAESATASAMILAALATIALSALTGLFSGAFVVRCGVPPFIATLAMMQVASGLAYIVSEGKPIYRLPPGFVGLGRGADPLLGIPYAVLLLLALYALAHVVMTRTVLGRHVYAVGGNAEAARLAGVRVHAVTALVYAVSGGLAGLGGVLLASQLKSGAPTYGLMYELYVIAAVVVGGTSLSGGEGRVLGTLTGALIIAVIQNGMNLTHVESYTQKVVLGLLILGAVLLDRIKRRGWRRSGPRATEAAS
jgi:ribose transport system permease protein